MKGVTIKLLNNLPYGSRLFVDGKETRVKRNKRGVSEVFVGTENDTAEIRIVNIFDGQLQFWKWFLITFVCWIISVFGLFDSVSNGKGRTVDLNLGVKTAEDAFLALKFNAYRNDKPAAAITETNTEINEVSNRYYTDKRAKKRNKFYKIWRIFSVVAAAIVLIVIISARS